MRRFTVTWTPFTTALPPRGARIVVEVPRESGMLAPGHHEANRDTVRPHRHASECVTGTFFLTMPDKTGRRYASINKQHGDDEWVPTTCRWYLVGSERRVRRCATCGGDTTNAPMFPALAGISQLTYCDDCTDRAQSNLLTAILGSNTDDNNKKAHTESRTS